MNRESIEKLIVIQGELDDWIEMQIDMYIEQKHNGD